MRFTLLSLATILAVTSFPAAEALPLFRDFCRGTNSTDPASLCGDVLLGLHDLPETGPLSFLVHNYHRLGGLHPVDFLAKWTVNGSYIFPEHDGFQLSASGSPIEGNETFTKDMLLDRFGRPTGRFLSPADTPYAQRSLPPPSLANYHVYRVETDNLTVLTGTIAPWFSQPGQGTQYELPEGESVQSLLDSGVLTEVPQ
ncbi:hypothetical protein C8R46DRAFT_1139744 [Mycena filopes]|nr:hypothetical protein C8R46DRAFT_1139744 [Mycena filopes]